jgi:DNA polymerase
VKPETREKLAGRLRYFQDLGITTFYRDRRVHAQAYPPPSATPAVETPVPAAAAPKFVVPHAESLPKPRIVVQQVVEASLFEPARIEGDTLERIRADIGEDCRRCKLCRKRKTIVFGEGHPRAELVFVGEGPGADEDEQGRPFVGRAGKLLTDMIEKGMGLKRSDVYICNVVKCRPPENRVPEKDEVAECSPFLFRQIAVIQPKVVVGLGASAMAALVGAPVAITKIHGEWIDWRGTKLMPVYHPAYLLRNPAAKPEAWEDLKKVMAYLGIPVPRRSGK